MTHAYSFTPEKVAQEIIERAKEIISEELARGLEVAKKADNTPVTQIDKKINQVAVGLIEKHFPNDAVYAEEGNGGKGVSGYTWVIDPIDGTQALALNLPTYTVCIARVEPDGQPEFSFVYNPSTEEIYQASRSIKATKNGKDLSVMKRAESLKGALVYLSSRMPEENIEAGELYEKIESEGAGIVNTHAVAYGALLVAEGKIEVAVAGVRSPYELAAVKLLVESAGGVVGDLRGRPIARCDTGQRGFIAATNEDLLRKLATMCRQSKVPRVVPEHEAIIRKNMSQALVIRHAPAGYINDVYIVDDSTVFRFPKTHEGRDILRFETSVLEKLQGHVTVNIPKVRYVEPDGNFAEVSYLQGKQLGRDDIAWFNVEQKRAFARAVAGFMKELNRALPKDWLVVQNDKLPVNRKDDANYYEELLRVGKQKNNPFVAQYEQCFNKLMLAKGVVFPSDEIVVHGDLNNSNFLFDESNELVAIVDFGDCMLHSVYFELRQLYQLGEDVVSLVIEELGGEFGHIVFDIVRLFALTHEFSALMRQSLDRQMPYDNDRAELAKRLLQDWGEL